MSNHEDYSDDALAVPSQLSDMLTNPFRTSQGFIEYCLAWMFTRQWSALLGFLPVLLILFEVILLVPIVATADPGPTAVTSPVKSVMPVICEFEGSQREAELFQVRT